MKYIDIRNNKSYLEGHIKDAININEYDLLINHKKYLNKNEKYIIYCSSGIRSRMVVANLLRMGYNVENLNGGYNKYYKY